jgi:uncharacterized protein (DUF1330 family)
MSAFVILDIDVTDPALYEEYKRLASATVIAKGGTYVARGGRTEVLEGTWDPKRVVVLQFQSTAQAKEWIASKEYAPARAIRHQAARTNVIVVEGL